MELDRRTLLIGGLAVGAAAVVGPEFGIPVGAAGGRLRWRGVNLDTDRTLWRPDFVQHELATIADDLHANAVLVLGSDVERLIDTAAMAADEGLSVWLEPRHFDSDAAGTLDYVAEVAHVAEALRSNYSNIGLSVGVELTLFMDGLVPGDGWLERGGTLATADPGDYNAGLNEFLSSGVQAIRPIFGGLLTYSSGPWEAVDWSPFDVVGVDFYRDTQNRAGLRR